MSENPIDLAVYPELKATTGPEFVVELVDTFLEEAPGTLAEGAVPGLVGIGEGSVISGLFNEPKRPVGAGRRRPPELAATRTPVPHESR